MTWLRDRALPILGVFCLVGQGALIFWGSFDERLPEMRMPGLFLAFSVVLAVVVALAVRRGLPGPEPVSRRGDLLGRALLVVAGASLLALALGVLVMGQESSPTPAGSAGRAADPELAHALADLDGLEPALEEFATAVAADLAQGTLNRNESAAGAGHRFHRLAGWPDRWAGYFSHHQEWPLTLILWCGRTPVAWTDGAVPLMPATPPAAQDHSVRIQQDADGAWFVRHYHPVSSECLLEVQLGLPEPGQLRNLPRGEILVGRVDSAPQVPDGTGQLRSSVFLQDSRAQRALFPALRDNGLARSRETNQARLMLALVAGWFLCVLGVGRLFGGWRGLLVGLWSARGLLAALDYFRWAGVAFPTSVDPAPPGHIISLVGPAYFATPFAGGWFASTADALLTALVVAGTVWALLWRGGWLGASDPEAQDETRARGWRLPPLLARRPLLAGAVFGLLGAGAFLGLRSFAGLVTDNANPRLIGEGISLSFLSFWGLHIALMLISLSLAALVTVLGARGAWPRRSELPSWLATLVVVWLVATGLFLAGGLQQAGSVLLGASGVAVLWALAPALVARPRFLRRFAWPVVLLVVVVWNYAALRQVYDRAERTWLEGKGQLIAAADDDWTRFLVEDALLEMQNRDASGSLPAHGGRSLWRDQPAFQLWSSSSLRDLGYSCLVEIMDPSGQQESLFATGFMRDFQYEVLERGFWTNRQGEPVDEDWEMIFQTERRSYAGGEEEILSAEIVRQGGRGWIRVELPTRSWRISTLLADLTGGLVSRPGYQPRNEVDRPVLLLRGDALGWQGTGDPGFTGPATAELVRSLKSGARSWAILQQGAERWLCYWIPLPRDVARTPGEGFLLGLRQSGLRDDILDLSRLMLLNLALLFFFFAAVQAARRLLGGGGNPTGDPDNEGRAAGWLPGFQEKFLAGYLLLGMLLLLVVGASVDQVGYERVRGEARQQTRQGLTQAVGQLRNLLAEQASSLASSEYIADLLVGELEGQRPAGPLALRQGMVFAADGTLLLDETLSNLTDDEASMLLQAARRSDLIIIQEEDMEYVATSIVIELGEAVADVAEGSDGRLPAEPGHGGGSSRGYFLYRQSLDGALVGGLADLVQGQATLRLDGQPVLASHPGPIFSRQAPLLASPTMMASLLDHPGGPGVFAQPGRPFAFIGAQPMPVFARDEEGRLIRRELPAVLALGFPDREREYAGQRRETVLFLAGLANLILLTALGLALVMSWNLFRPLRVLLTATRRLARGDFQAPLPMGGQDEVGRLTTAFRTMRGELHSARERLAAREQFLTTILDQVSVGVAVLDRQGRPVVLNPAGRHILTDFYPELREEDGARCLLDEVRQQAGERPRWGGELRSVDGQRTLRTALAPLRLPDQDPDTLVVFEDITEFLQTKKLAINAELARQVAHEIKNPLTPIRLSIQLLDQAWRDGHPQLDRIVNETVTRVLDQVELLRTIASEFSLLGRPGELDLQALDLPAFTREVVGAYSGPLVGDQQQGGVEVADQEIPLVLAEAESLRKILGNLVQNSMDAARPGHPWRVEVTWQVHERRVDLVWTDNGQGLDPAVAEKLFDPYFSTKSKGTGLGLAICRNLADRMGGGISLRNRKDGPGACAVLSLPRVGEVGPE